MAKKYIDIGHLKVEIEKHIKEVKDAADRFTPNMGFFDAKLSGIYDVMAIIDSLQQEQTKDDWREKRKEECPFRRNLDNNLYGCERYADVVYSCDGKCSWVVDYPKFKEIQDKKEQEQPEVNLEEFIEKMDAWKARFSRPDDIPIKATMAFTARMFYQYPDVARQWYEQLPKATMD